jgi:hypothetical protein
VEVHHACGQAIASILTVSGGPSSLGQVFFEPLETRRLMANTIQVQITSDVVGVSARDLQNIGINFQLKGVQGLLTLTGNNLAAQTVGKQINITGTTTAINDLSLVNETLASSIVVRANPDVIPLLSFETTEPMKLIDLRPLLLSGDVNVMGAPKMMLGDGSGANIHISQGIPSMTFSGGTFRNSQISIMKVNPSASTAMNLRDLVDSHVGVDGYLRSLTLNSATESSAGMSGITANSAGTIKVGSDYKADLTFRPTLGLRYTLSSYKAGGVTSGTWDIPGVTGSLYSRSLDSSYSGSFGAINRFSIANDFSGSLTAGSIGAATVGGNMLNGWLKLVNPYTANALDLGSLRVHNSINNFKIISNGNMGVLDTMFTYSSQIAAGLNSSYVFGQPLMPSDYTSLSYIRSFTSDCPSHHNIHFVGSTVGAYTLQNVHLGNVETQSGGLPIGLAGYDMGNVLFLLNSKPVRLKMLTSQAGLDAGLQQNGLTRQSLGNFDVLLPM